MRVTLTLALMLALAPPAAAAGPKAVAILKSGKALTIATPGKRERVPLRGVAGPLAGFETACFGRR